MKILLDEHFGEQVVALFQGVGEVFTVKSMGFGGLPNGQLLQAAADSGFNLLITGDANMRHQQNEATLPISVIVLRLHRTQARYVRVYVPRIRDMLREGPLLKRFYVLTPMLC